MAVDQKLRTADPTYDLVSVLYHALQGGETYQQYISDAEETGDNELVDFFRDVQEKEKQIAEQAKRLLHSRLK
jgi:hypothetical protein